MPGSESPDRVDSPTRRQNDLCSRAVQELRETRQQLFVDDVRKLAGIWRFIAVENAIDIKKYHLHCYEPDFA